MANINVKARLTRIDADLKAVVKHVKMHSGVSKGEAMLIDNLLSDIAINAASLAEDAREAYGSREAKGSLVKKIRKALGYTIP